MLTACSNAPSTDIASLCDQACLRDVTEKFLNAKTNNDLSDLPLASNLRVTSNSKAVELGAGETWHAGVTIVNRYTFVDSQTQSVVFFGTIADKPDDNRRWWHYSLRLSLDTDGNISEIEEQSNTKGFQTADKVEIPFKESAIFDAVLPLSERVSKAELIKAADSYWDGLTSGKGKDVLFGPDCQRSEFGKYSTNRLYSHDRNADPDFVPTAIIGKSCRAFFDTGRFRWTTDNRRYYIVDEERGIVVGVGQLKKYGKNGIPGLTLMEAFKIKNGRIEFLWAPAFNWSVEESGWPDWERALQ